jgi:hypothetical protein
MPQICSPSLLAKVTIELFNTGRRTVSFRDLVTKLDRDFDHDFAERVVDQLVDTAEIVERAGYPCTPVNDFCARQYAETPIADVATARRCNVYNSGGKRPVAIRRALPDDLVRGEVNGSGAHLGIGLLKHISQENANDVARGITAPETGERLRRHLREELPRIPEIEPDAQQSLLPTPDDDEEN